MKVDLAQKVELESTPLQVGQQAPNFVLTKMDGFVVTDVTLDEFKDKIKIISCFPSIDTGICDLQTKTFFSKFGNDNRIYLINVSADLMFAQLRWCNANNAQNNIMLSDYKTHQFAKDYGINIKGANLVYRSLFILDQNNVIKYIQLASEVKANLDYDAVESAVKQILG